MLLAAAVVHGVRCRPAAWLHCWLHEPTVTDDESSVLMLITTTASSLSSVSG
jgi:hypothetical protein